MLYDEEHHESCTCGICQTEASFEVISYDDLPKEPEELVQAEDIALHICVRGRTRRDWMARYVERVT